MINFFSFFFLKWYCFLHNLLFSFLWHCLYCTKPSSLSSSTSCWYTWKPVKCMYIENNMFKNKNECNNIFHNVCICKIPACYYNEVHTCMSHSLIEMNFFSKAMRKMLYSCDLSITSLKVSSKEKNTIPSTTSSHTEINNENNL